MLSLNIDKYPPLVLIGGGGHASVLVDLLRQDKREILAIISPEDISSREVFKGMNHFLSDNDIHKYSPDEVRLVNGVGMLPGSKLRKKIGEYYSSLGYKFETIISKQAIVSEYAKVQEGAQVLNGAIVQAGSQIGRDSIINTGALIEHDTVIGDYNHIGPMAVLCGGVFTKNDVFIGANATVIQGVHLGNQVIVGAGAVVTSSLDSQEVCFPGRATVRHSN